MTATSGANAEVEFAKNNTLVEILIVCQKIDEHGNPSPEGGKVIEFEKLFDAADPVASNLVGSLISARKMGLIKFQGQFLLIGPHNHTPIQMPWSIDEVKAKLAKQGMTC